MKTRGWRKCRKLSLKLFNVDQKKKIVQIKIRRKILLLMTQWTDSGYETDTCVLQVDPRRRIPSVPPRFNQSKRRIAFPPWSLPSVRGYRHLSTTLTNQSSLWSRACQNAARGTSPNVIGPMVSRAAEDWRCSMRYITNMIGPVLFAGILVHNTAHTTHVVSFDQSGAVQLQYRFLQLDWSCPARDVLGFFFRSCWIWGDYFFVLVVSKFQLLMHDETLVYG